MPTTNYEPLTGLVLSRNVNRGLASMSHTKESENASVDAGALKTFMAMQLMNIVAQLQTMDVDPVNAVKRAELQGRFNALMELGNAFDELKMKPPRSYLDG